MSDPEFIKFLQALAKQSALDAAASTALTKAYEDLAELLERDAVTTTKSRPSAVSPSAKKTVRRRGRAKRQEDGPRPLGITEITQDALLVEQPNAISPEQLLATLQAKGMKVSLSTLKRILTQGEKDGVFLKEGGLYRIRGLDE